MNKQLRLVEDFHKKFHALIGDKPSNLPEDRYQNRYALMKEELEEYLQGAKKGDIQNVAKELSDLLYALYGTIIEHGLQDIFEDLFEEVHRSHMTKDYHKYKMIKGDSYKKADIGKFFT